MTTIRHAALAAALGLCAALSPLAAHAEAGADATVQAEANGITIADAYARSAGKMAKAGAAFMAVTNSTGTDDRITEARSDIAERVELHTHIVTDGVARMTKLEEGIPVPAGETVMLERGGLHVMFMGLRQGMEEGGTVKVTLVFENAGEIPVAIPVDLARGGMRGEGQGDGQGHGHGHGNAMNQSATN